MPVIPLFSSALPEMCRMEIRRPFSAAGSRPARTDLSPSGHAPLHDPGVSLPAADVLLCKRRFLRRYCKARQCNALSPVHAARKRLPRRRCVQWGTLRAVSARKNRYSRAGNPGYCKKMRLYPHLRPSGIHRLFRNRRHGLLRFPSHCRDTIAAFRVGAAGWSEIPYTGSARRMHRSLLRYICIAARMGSRNVCCGNPPD